LSDNKVEIQRENIAYGHKSQILKM